MPIFFSVIISLAVCAVVISLGFGIPIDQRNDKGQPGCKTNNEIEIGLYPYFDDAQFYWECVQPNVDAICRYCPIGTLFQANLRICVAAELFEWTEKEQPPSSPDVITNECTVPASVRPTNGQPGCKTIQEIEQRYHANPDDITRYWECSGLNEVAICQKCPDATVFELDRCVAAGTEIWQPTSEPFSSPDVLVSCY